MAKNDKIYSMKEACKATGLTYDALKFYCNEGLIPNVKRDKNTIVYLMMTILLGLRVYLA